MPANSKNTGNRRANSGSFKPGDPRINRLGRPRKDPAIVEFLTAGGRDQSLYAAAFTLALDKRVPVTVRADMIKFLTPYLNGKAPDRLELSGPSGDPIETQEVNPVSTLLKQMAARVAKEKPGGDE